MKTLLAFCIISMLIIGCSDPMEEIKASDSAHVYDENRRDAIVAKEKGRDVIYDDPKEVDATNLNPTDANFVQQRQQELVRNRTDKGELYAIGGGSAAVLIFSSAIWLFRRHQ